MSDTERSSLLVLNNRLGSSTQSADNGGQESTPLLSSAEATPWYDGDGAVLADGASAPGKKSGKWPSIIAMGLLAALSLAVLVLAFAMPAAVEAYAKEAFVVEPTNLSVDSITAHGVRTRIQANIRLEGARVKNDHVRRVGRVVTRLVRELGTGNITIHAYLPDYGGLLLGQAALPPLRIGILEHRTTAVDFVADLRPGDTDCIRTVANQWLEGRLSELRLQATAEIPLKSGFVALGTHNVAESLTFKAKERSGTSAYHVSRLNVKEMTDPTHQQRTVVSANISVTASNTFPISLEIPILGFDIFVPGCDRVASYIRVADAVTAAIVVRPQTDITAHVRGYMRDIPEMLTRPCPDSERSPLDKFLKRYLGGQAAPVFVRAKKISESTIPDWLSEIMTSMLAPVPFPGHSGGNMIREFALSDVQFTMPDPGAEPGTDESSPRVSGSVEVLAALPSEMNVGLNVTGIRATADVLYKTKKLGELYVRPWHAANSTRVQAAKHNETDLKIQCRIDNAPLNVTDSDVLTDLIQNLLFGGEHVVLNVTALVDVRLNTVLGQVILKDVPASGKVPVQRPSPL